MIWLLVADNIGKYILWACPVTGAGLFVRISNFGLGGS